MNKGYNLREVRTSKGYSQLDIANVLNTTQQQYSKYETGTQELPARHIVTLCEFYHVSADYLLGISETQEPSKENLKKYEIKNTMTGESATMYFAENITIGDN